MHRPKTHQQSENRLLAVIRVILIIIVSVIMLYMLAASPSPLAQAIAFVVTTSAFIAFALIGLRDLNRS